MTLFQKIKDPVIRVWSKFGLLLNRLFTPLILGCIYFIVLVVSFNKQEETGGRHFFYRTQ